MSRRGLTARLDASGDRILCGRCSAELAHVWDGGLGERHRRVVFGLGWSLTAGIWRVSPRAVAALAQGRRPMRRTVGTGNWGLARMADGTLEPARVERVPMPDGWIAVNPIRAACPACSAVQSFDPQRLRTDPSGDTTGKVRSVARWSRNEPT